MPIQKRWSRFTFENIRRVPQEEGAYQLANAARAIIYNGSSNNLRRRLYTHFTQGRLTTARYFRCEVCSIFDLESSVDKEARHAERFFATRGRKPRYTKRSPRRHSLFDF